VGDGYGPVARVIEEAWYQEALLDINRLCVLFPLNVRATRERVGSLIEQDPHPPFGRDKPDEAGKVSGITAHYGRPLGVKCGAGGNCYY